MCHAAGAVPAKRACETPEPAGQPAKRARRGDLPAAAARAAQRTKEAAAASCGGADALPAASGTLTEADAAPAEAAAGPRSAAEVRRAVTAYAGAAAVGPTIGGMDAATRQTLSELGYASPLMAGQPRSAAATPQPSHLRVMSAAADAAAVAAPSAAPTPGELTDTSHPGMASPPFVYGTGRGRQGYDSRMLDAAGANAADAQQPRRLEKLLSLTLTPAAAAEAGSGSSARTPTLVRNDSTASPDGGAMAQAGQRGSAAGGAAMERQAAGGGAGPSTQDSGTEALTSQQADTQQAALLAAAPSAPASPAAPKDLGAYFGMFRASSCFIIPESVGLCCWTFRCDLWPHPNLLSLSSSFSALLAAQ